MRIPLLCTFILTFILSLARVSAQKTHVINSTIKEVTLYRNGAKVSRDVMVSLDEGLHELLFKGLSSSLDKESIRLSGLADLTVLSVLPRVNYNQEGERSKVMAQLEAKNDLIKGKLDFERGLLQVYKQEEEMLIKNQQLGGDKTAVKTLELKEAIDFQRKRLVEILQKKLETADNIKKWEDSLKVVSKELSPLKTESQKATMEIAVAVSVKKATQVRLELGYYIADAGWYPSYDAKLTELSAPLMLQFKAGMFQYSGEDWKKVKLTLSTANPKDRALVPELRTWYWGSPNDYSQYRALSSDNLPVTGSVAEVSGFVKDEQNDPLPGVSVLIKGTSIGTNTDANGFYQISIPTNVSAAQRSLEFSFIGYIAQSKVITTDRINTNMQPDVMALNEVVVVGYGDVKKGSAGKLAGAVAGANRQQSIRLDTDEKESATSVTYEIPLPYTLLSDGKTYTADLKSEEIKDSYYEYLTVPKIRQDVYLNAYLPSWSSLSLLPGDVNLYLENSYVGKTRLDPANAPDTLSLSFGIDRSVAVHREQIKTFTKKQFLGGNITENRVYKITVKNLKKAPVRVAVKDQYPLAKSKEIEISDKAAPDARVNDDTGEVTWMLTLAAGQSKELDLRYAVKYPKNGYVKE